MFNKKSKSSVIQPLPLGNKEVTALFLKFKLQQNLILPN